jgi:hypothetical protein
VEMVLHLRKLLSWSSDAVRSHRWQMALMEWAAKTHHSDCYLPDPALSAP